MSSYLRFVPVNDAINKWCPFTRVVQWGDSGSPGAGNREASSSREFREAACCVANQCMVWVEEHPRPDNWQPGEELPNGRCGMAKPRPSSPPTGP